MTARLRGLACVASSRITPGPPAGVGTPRGLCGQARRWRPGATAVAPPARAAWGGGPAPGRHLPGLARPATPRRPDPPHPAAQAAHWAGRVRGAPLGRLWPRLPHRAARGNTQQEPAAGELEAAYSP